MKPRLNRALMAAALLLTTIFGGCATTQQVVKRQLPPESDVVLDPVPVPRLKKGDDARLGLAKTGAALKEANGRLVKSRVIYRGVRNTYGGR